MAATNLDSGPFDFKFKLLLVGDGDVGKVDLLNRYISEGAPGCIDYKTHAAMIEGKKVQLQIWDTAGQERFRAITSSYYHGAHGAMVVFDVGNKDSYDHVQDWFRDIDRYCDPSIAKVLVGHTDYKPVPREVDQKVAMQYADNQGIPYFEASGRDGTNVEQAFTALAKEAFETYKRQNQEPIEFQQPPAVPDIPEGKEPKPKKKICLI
eukprot:TRINITY_DN1286_c0_g1_i2.p1 TRINITY_DN1286_c0_g1~~TRINITY_DN1286_c0_g1_i2.p1  ORF type:complete len:208 (+),score=24.00 TRINITY_DN1286_c0_g1_i2:582-1205(+)